LQTLIAQAAEIGAKLKARGETIVICESSSGGLISAALLSVPGASAYYLGGAVVYTRKAGENFLTVPREDRKGVRSASEPYALQNAQNLRERFGSTWALAETGASGPTGNAYGDAPGHSCYALVGPVERTFTLETGRSDRVENMRAFAAKGLALLAEALA
jgi:nicotinamide-nucleotide amidase